MGSNPAIIIPAPKATPATEAVMPNQVSNGIQVGNAEPATIKTPINHMRSFNAKGFHLATSTIPPIRPRLIVMFSDGSGHL